jgi:DNA-binding MarR family transcriptional regulator
MQARNVFGAVSLALADEILHDTTLHAPEAGPAGSALALIGHRPGLSIRTLAESVALTHAGAVRLVDRLESEGLIERRTHATDGRTRALYLTEAGEKASSSVLQARDSVLERGFAALTKDEQQMLGQLAERMLRAAVRDEDHSVRVCRLCDISSCPDCPVDAELKSRQCASAA